MTWLISWAIGAIILFAVFCYIAGRFADADDGEALGGIFFVAFASSILWPIIITGLIVFGPFYGLYKYGAHRSKIAAEKKKMWETLQK